MRARKPWFRSSKNAWYVEVDGKQVRLAIGAENEKAAFDAFYKLMATGSPQIEKGLSVASIGDLFLDFSSVHHEKSTYETYRYFIQDFCKLHPRLLALETKPFHVSRWVDQRKNWKGARWHAIATIKRVFSWAEQEGLISANPIKNVKKLPIGRRERQVSPAEREQILSAITDQVFKDFVLAMQHTGCRPSEVAQVTASDCNLDKGVWILQTHKTAKKTGRPRVVYLTPIMVEMSRRLSEKNPTGVLFRNARNKPFTKNAIRCRFRRIREKHPNLAGIVSYCYRHSFATEALEKNVGIAQVAELLGHTNTTMISKHYGHLSDNVAHMRNAALKATQGEAK